MGLFSRFHETSDEHNEANGVNQEDGRPAAGPDHAKKGFIESMGEMVQHSVHNVREVMLGHAESGTVAAAAPAMEEELPDQDGEGETKTVMQVVGEKLVESAQTVKEAVLKHTEASKRTAHEHIDDPCLMASDPSEEGHTTNTPLGNNGDDEGRLTKTVVQSVGEMLSHSIETVKEVVLGAGGADHHHESSHDVHAVSSKPEVDESHPLKGEDEEEDKSLIQNVKEAAQSVKEAVLSNDRIAHVQECITEEGGERPSMELLHTIVHD